MSSHANVMHASSHLVPAVLRRSFEAAAPFPHIVLPGLFEDEFLETLGRGFDNVAPPAWRSHHTGLLKKKTLSGVADMPAPLQSYFEIMSSPAMLDFLGDLTGIDGLSADPSLHGGGMHEVSGGGHFEIHVDFRRHPASGMTNRLVVITYLNRHWTPDDGGALELWEMEPPRPVATIEPLFGHTFVMSQSALAAHGYPHPTRTGTRRRALVSYYYTDADPGADVPLTDTRYVRYPQQKLVRRALIYARAVLPTPLVRSARLLLSYVMARPVLQEPKAVEPFGAALQSSEGGG